MFKKLLTCAAIALGCGSMWAQTKTDVTSKITNPSFENNGAVVKKSNLTAACTDITGWTITTTNTGYNNEEVLDANTENSSAFGKKVTPKDGTYYFFARQGWFGSNVNITMQTTTAELAAGEYELTVDYMATENSTAQDKLKFSVSQTEELGATEYNFARNTSSSYFTTASNWQEGKVTFTVATAGTVTIEVKAILNGNNSARADFILDNFKLAKVEGADVSALDAKITAVQAVVDNSTGDKTAINAAITIATGIKNNPTSQTAVDQAVTDLNTAYETYILVAVPNSGYTFDYTFKVGDIYNTGSWTSTTGAKNTVWKAATEKNTEDCVATGFYENWNGSAYDGKLYHQFTELRAGIYNVTALAFANTGDGTAKVYGNKTTADLSGETDKFQQITVEGAVVTDGKLEVGLEVAGKTWVGISTINLAYVRELTSSDFPTYTLAKGAMNKDIAAAQTQAESTYTTNVTLANYNALTEAIKAANASVQTYANIKAYYDMTSEKVSGDYSSYTSDYNAGNYETEAQGIVAIKAIRNGIATSGMAAGADLTSLIDNPDFETGNTNYWNTIASSDTGVKKNEGDLETWNMNGTYYFNTWWQGTPITQNLGKLPVGVYELGATIASNGGTIYMTVNGEPVGYIETVDAGVGITGNSMFTLTEEAEVTIGVVGGGKGSNVAGQHKPFQADGYWFYRADDFKLKYLGATAPENTIDGVYTLTFDGFTFLSRGGDSGTEAVTSADNPLAVKITTVSAGIQTIQFMDTKGYMMWNGEMVYTDGTMEPKKETHLSYWKVEKADGVNNYTILNTQSGGYLTMTTATRDGNEINVATLGGADSWGLAKLNEEQLAAVQDMIDLANATTIPTDEAEIGNGVFQYSADNIEEADSWVSILKGASAVVLVKMYNTEDFVADKADMIEAVNNMLTLNAPTATKAYKIILKADESTYAHDNRAITSKAGDRKDMGNYNLQYLSQNDNYAQSMFFTAKDVEGKLNTYTISFTDADGNTRYISTGVPYSGNTSQIRTTTNAEDALVVEIVRNGANIKLMNSAANQFIGSQDAGVYTVSQNNNFTVAEVATQNAISKTVAEGKYATVVLPYAATLTTGKAYTATVDGSSVNLEEVTSLEANKAYILGEGTYNFTGVNIAFAEPKPSDNDVLTGVYTATAVPVGSYVLQTKDGTQKFYKVAEGSQPTLSANKAYLTVPATEAKALNIALAGEETAIKAIDALVNGDAKIFDLNGRELKSLQKGVNIVNGVKVFVK